MKEKRKQTVATVFFCIGIFLLLAILIMAFVTNTESMDAGEVAHYALYSGYAKGLCFVCFLVSLLLKPKNK